MPTLAPTHGENMEPNRAIWKSLLSKLVPGILGCGLFAINSLDVIHGLLAPPAGYVPLGVQRNQDVALYLTWLQGLARGWHLPNYHAPWSTTADFLMPALIPVSILQRALSLNPILALQLFSLAGYIFTAYAVTFAYKTFCETRRQAVWALLIAFSCVPVLSLPGLSYLLKPLQDSVIGTHAQFMALSDGFVRGLVLWPFRSFGTGFQVLSMALLARYSRSPERRWLGWLALTCLLSTVMHPFEIFVTLAAVGIVLLRQFGPNARSLASLFVIFTAAGVGLSPYVIQTLRSPWVREVAEANHLLSKVMPAPLLAMIGLPAILVIFLLLLGFPENRRPETIVLRTWFLSAFAVFFMPRMPYALHFMDGIFFAIGLLLVIQVEELLTRWPVLSRPLPRALAVLVLLGSLVPQAVFRWQSWDTGVARKNTPEFPTAISPLGEFATVQWLREHGNPEDLVLATEDAAPWLATAPIHSYASHWLASLWELHPHYNAVRNSFFDGTLSHMQAQEFVETLGVRFVVVPDESPAKEYLEKATLRVHFNTRSIYELPGTHMKPYHDSRILALENSSP